MKNFKDMLLKANEIAKKRGDYIVTDPSSDVDLKEKAEEMKVENKKKKKKKPEEKESMMDAAKRVGKKHGYIDISIRIKQD